MNATATETERPVAPPPSPFAGLLRTVLAGVLMGVANIIPGVSGGTMILAMGLYERFVDAVAELTRLRFRLGSIVFLVVLGVSATIALMLSVGPINWGLVHHQHIMFALFIGLTLGGVPIVVQEMRPVRPVSIVTTVIGVAFMIFISFWLGGMELPLNFLVLLIAGIIGSAAMVLPGISGSYMLLAMGLYFPITRAIDEFKDGLRALDIGAAFEPAFTIMLPVGIGVIVGIAGLSNVLKAALRRYHDATMGILLGLLLGSVFFLYPFREPGSRDPFDAAAPMTAWNVAFVVACVGIGFFITWRLSQVGRREHVTI